MYDSWNSLKFMKRVEGKWIPTEKLKMNIIYTIHNLYTHVYKE